MINKICNYGVKLVEIISMIGISLILVFTIYEVSVREIIGKPTTWTNELTSYILVWFGLLSVIYAYEKKAHVSVDLIYCKLNFRVQRVLDLTNDIAMIVFASFILFYGYKYWWLGYSRGWHHVGMMDVPMSYTRIAVPITGLMLLLLIARSIVEKIQKLGKHS